MEQLRLYEGKTVALEAADGEIYTGYVGDYIFADDNVPAEIEALVLNCPVRSSDGYRYSSPVEFTAREIKSVRLPDDSEAD